MALQPGQNVYELQRKRAAQQSEADNQQEQDALKRRFAAQGGLNSGAFIKQQQITSDNAMKRKQSALENVDMAESAELQRQKEIQEGRDFSRSEREAGQQYSSGENALQRRFQTSEREGSQGFTAGQADIQRQFQTGERVAGQTYQTGEREAGQAYSTGERIAGQEYQTGQLKSQQDFQAAQQKLQNENAALEAEKQRLFQAGENEAAREIEKQQLALAQQQATLDQEMQNYDFTNQKVDDSRGALENFWLWLSGN